MNKRTYNSLKTQLKQAAEEAWEKYYDLAIKGEIGKASSYAELYGKIYLLDIHLKDLVEEEEEAR